MLKPADLRVSRLVVVNPAPIPEVELQCTYEWVRGGARDEVETPAQLVNMNVQSHAHIAQRGGPRHARARPAHSSCFALTPTKRMDCRVKPGNDKAVRA